jgi:ubiquinone/menaquinone biosynthesis C-methylase UbiE
MSTQFTVRSEVENRYASAARAQEAALCCPVEYDRKWLEAIPAEVIEKDYGCGDPSKWLQPGETVLDLGSGTGKICFIASQVVGAEGRVIGVDMTDDMLEVARRNAPVVGERIGFSNTEFRKGRIQDLRLDLEAFDAAMAELPADAARDYLAIEDLAADLRTKQPLVADDSIDVVVSNCVLNLVEAEEKPRLFRELFRVLKKGGRAIISDIVADEPVPTPETSPFSTPPRPSASRASSLSAARPMRADTRATPKPEPTPPPASKSAHAATGNAAEPIMKQTDSWIPHDEFARQARRNPMKPGSFFRLLNNHLYSSSATAITGSSETPTRSRIMSRKRDRCCLLGISSSHGIKREPGHDKKSSL